jgi:hypothetical protein
MIETVRPARSKSAKGSRSDSEALWDWNLESDRIHFSPRWRALAGCEDHEVGSAPADWFRRVTRTTTSNWFRRSSRREPETRRHSSAGTD